MTKHKIPLGLGNCVEVLGVLLAIYLLVLAADTSNLYLRFFMYLISWGCFLFFPHCLAHFLVGSTVGVRFKYYYLGRSGVSKLRLPVVSLLAARAPVLTLVVDLKSMSAVSPGRRAVMYASGAAASMILPFIVVAASFPHLPLPLTAVFVLLSVANLTFDLYYSPKAGDISRGRATAR